MATSTYQQTVQQAVTEPAVIKKVSQILFIKYDEHEKSDKKNLHAGATSLDTPLKACKFSETEWFFPYKKFGHPDKM